MIEEHPYSYTGECRQGPWHGQRLTHDQKVYFLHTRTGTPAIEDETTLMHYKKTHYEYVKGFWLHRDYA